MAETSLDEALDDRRVELDMQWIDVARLANISLSTLDRVRKGAGTKLKRRAVERALRLQAGSIERGTMEPLIEPERADPEDRVWDALRVKYEAWRAEKGPDEAWTMLRREATEDIRLIDERRRRHAERDHRDTG
jgi:hypothetical protein